MQPLTQGNKKNIYSVIGIVEGAGLEVVDITISGLADYYEVKNNKLDNKIENLKFSRKG